MLASPSPRLVLSLLLLTLPIAAQAPPRPAKAGAQRTIQIRPVQIENGKLLGVFSADQKVISYKGIPYAQPPIEELRWQPPAPMGKWKKVLYAHDFGAHCLQFGSSPEIVLRDTGPSEDCLTLNVWAPAIAMPIRRGLPVMVWIHGGDFSTGGASEPRYSGEALARRGVIVVSMNYRLGIFGFLALPELSQESPHHTSGNYGLMDQAAALAWVHRNIAAFGGDPANVTVFGQAAGADSISMLMAAPPAATLFARAIGQSGSEFPSPARTMPTREQAEPVNDSWTTRAFGSNKLFYLRQLTANEIMEAVQSRTRLAPRFGPVVDGYFLPDTIPHIYADGRQAHIPLLAGWVADEQHPDSASADALYAQVRDDFGSHAVQALALYPISTDSETLRSANDYAGDRAIAYAAWAWLEAQSRTGNAPVYRYLFALPSPGDRIHPAALGAFHSSDIEYVFGTLDARPGITRPEDHALSDLMQQYWINFAGTGDPNGPGLPPWPSYNHAAGTTQAAPVTNRATVATQLTSTNLAPVTVQSGDAYSVMRLDATPAAKPDALRPRYLLLDQFWSGQ